ncbi:M24 family metallopeptidase [Nonomuraea fuscirosea]|uniref:M24 family metallopeptidase n=1 Tax=Nonomuraea fuscirosea TaxID=1291556 RepID=UPI00343AF30F
MVAPRAGEREISDRIRDLANDMFSTTKYWHKRIIRSGPNTLLPNKDNPLDRIIGEDDVAFADFGSIFEEYEADFGRTYAFGDDPGKHRLPHDLPRVFDAETGIATTTANDPAHRRLTQMRDFYQFMLKEIPTLLHRWQEHQAMHSR